MSDTNQPPASDTKRKARTADSIENLQRLVDSMSAEDREKLERAGVVIPTGALTSVQDDTFTWGVRCTHCNSIALYFVGEKWTVDGIETEMPPPLPHNRVMWTQRLPPDEIDRNEPRCQNCGNTVSLNRDRSFSRERERIVRVADFEASRDASYDRVSARKIARKLEQGGASVEAAGAFDRDYDRPKEAVSKVIARTRGDQALDDIAAVAQLTGADKFGKGK